MRLEKLRGELVRSLRRVAAAGLVLGAAGNASARDPESGLVVVSPTGLPYEETGPADVAVVEPGGRLLEGGPPSVELPMHLAILEARPEVGAVVHTHSPHATALGCVLDEIPAITAELAATVGGAVPVSPYAPTATAEMGAAVLAAAGERWAAIVRNHGPVCLGRALADAVACAFAVEESAHIYALARAHGEPEPLPEAEVARVAALSGRRPRSPARG